MLLLLQEAITVVICVIVGILSYLILIVKTTKTFNVISLKTTKILQKLKFGQLSVIFRYLLLSLYPGYQSLKV